MNKDKQKDEEKMENQNIEFLNTKRMLNCEKKEFILNSIIIIYLYIHTYTHEMNLKNDEK